MEYVVVGLGNPGHVYADTRHNVGRMVLEAFRKAHSFQEWEERGELKALMSRGITDEKHVTLIEPDNYMNNSGQSVQKYLKERDESYLVVVHDDIDLPVGSVRVSHNRGAGGHNGVRSIEKHIGSKNFTRVRVGIAPLTIFGSMRKPQGDKAVQQFVLKPFGLMERSRIESSCTKAAQAIDDIILKGVEKAMNAHNAAVS